MRTGTLIDYRIRVHGIPIRWQTEIAEWQPPHHFVDRQLRGPYTLWHHTHTFEECNGGTRCLDHVFEDFDAGIKVAEGLAGGGELGAVVLDGLGGGFEAGAGLFGATAGGGFGRLGVGEFFLGGGDKFAGCDESAWEFKIRIVAYDFLAALDIGVCRSESGGGGGELGCQGFSAEGFPTGVELGDLLFEGLALFEDRRGVVEIAEGVAGKCCGPGTSGGLGADPSVC